MRIAAVRAERGSVSAASSTSGSSARRRASCRPCGVPRVASSRWACRMNSRRRRSPNAGSRTRSSQPASQGSASAGAAAGDSSACAAAIRPSISVSSPSGLARKRSSTERRVLLGVDGGQVGVAQAEARRRDLERAQHGRAPAVGAQHERDAREAALDPLQQQLEGGAERLGERLVAVGRGAPVRAARSSRPRAGPRRPRRWPGPRPVRRPAGRPRGSRRCHVQRGDARCRARRCGRSPRGRSAGAAARRARASRRRRGSGRVRRSLASAEPVVAAQRQEGGLELGGERPSSPRRSRYDQAWLPAASAAISRPSVPSPSSDGGSRKTTSWKRTASGPGAGSGTGAPGPPAPSSTTAGAAGRRLDDREQRPVRGEGERDGVRRGVERHARVEPEDLAARPRLAGRGREGPLRAGARDPARRRGCGRAATPCPSRRRARRASRRARLQARAGRRARRRPPQRARAVPGAQVEDEQAARHRGGEQPARGRGQRSDARRAPPAGAGRARTRRPPAGAGGAGSSGQKRSPSISPGTATSSSVASWRA